MVAGSEFGAEVLNRPLWLWDAVPARRWLSWQEEKRCENNELVLYGADHKIKANNDQERSRETNRWQVERKRAALP